MRSIPRSFFARNAVDVAPDLLGKVLMIGTDLGIRITETEAYLGDDEASHSFRGRTKRNAVMFGKPGFCYVYFIYGMYWCVNVVTGPESSGEAVLVRGGLPLRGIETMRLNRPKCAHDRDLASGPGKLTMALGINGSFNGLDMCASTPIDASTPNSIRLMTDNTIGSKQDQRILATKRVGIRLNVDRPWRFLLQLPPSEKK
jgi:DNA-3-methyladenine glycosylase